VKRWGLLAVAIAALGLTGPVCASAPPVQAEAYVVESSVDGRTLAAREADATRPMASLTKLMTVLVALERLSLDEIVTVPAAAARVGESSLDPTPASACRCGTS
jgi:D-alanyl-D-alanine carboxypeptidase (penicillin-binding protein 5/6)